MLSTFCPPIPIFYSLDQAMLLRVWILFYFVKYAFIKTCQLINSSYSFSPSAQTCLWVHACIFVAPSQCPLLSCCVQRTLEKEARQCQALVIWTDCDREGENIGFEIIDVCKAGTVATLVGRCRCRVGASEWARRLSELNTLHIGKLDFSGLRRGGTRLRLQVWRVRTV